MGEDSGTRSKILEMRESLSTSTAEGKTVEQEDAELCAVAELIEKAAEPDQAPQPSVY